MKPERAEALLHLNAAIGLLDREAPSVAACHVQTAIDLLEEDAETVRDQQRSPAGSD